VSRGQRNGSPRPLISVLWTGAATFYSSSSSIDMRMICTWILYRGSAQVRNFL